MKAHTRSTCFLEVPVRHRARHAARLLTALLALTAALAFAPFATAHAQIYWANAETGAIGRANLNGTGVNTRFITDTHVSGVAVDAAHVYWSNGDLIGRANLDGSGVDQSFIDSGFLRIKGLAVGTGHVYWAGLADGASGGWIGRATLDGTVDQSFFGGHPQLSFYRTRWVAVDAAHVYWNGSYGDTAIGRANLDGTRRNKRYIPGASAEAGLAVDASHVYFANRSGRIGRASLDGTRVTQRFITGVRGVSSVAVDAGHVYWTSGDAIGRANLDGTRVNERFITGVRGVTGVAVDAARQGHH